MSSCTLCNEPIDKHNVAIFPCAHTFHLSCVLSMPYSTQCSECATAVNNKPDLGLDREIASNAELITKISQRRLKPLQDNSILQSVFQVLTPLTPAPQSFVDYIKQNKKLCIIESAGFGPEDAVQERVRFSDIVKRYSGEDIINFGFTWDHMIKLGILPGDLSAFTWTQQIHKIKLNATKMLQMRLTLTELSDMQYTTHQLIELGFTWPILTSMGANVDTWKRFEFELEDLKRYWEPTLTQWVAAGFYDKERVRHAGWPMDDVLSSLPAMTDRAAGRVLRLTF